VAGDKDHSGGHVWIESTRGADDEPVCLVTVGPYQSYPSVDEVRRTAIDLVTCAAYAEMMGRLIRKVKLPPETAAEFVSDIMASSGRRFFGTVHTLMMLPATQHHGRSPVVVFDRGKWDGLVTADEARDMALYWLSVAEATESDQLVTGAMADAGIPAGVQAMIFQLLHAQRSDQPEDLAGQAGEAGD
jgi:hypothetical protein